MTWNNVVDKAEALRSRLNQFVEYGETNYIVMVDKWGKLEAAWDDVVDSIEHYFIDREER